MGWLPQYAGPPTTSVQALKLFADRVVKDARVEGIVVTVPPLKAGWAVVESAREQLQRLRDAGKEIVVFLPRGGGNLELVLATAANRITMAPPVTLGPLGIAAEKRYIKPLLDKVGIEVEVEARREYKTAAEPAVLDSMSDQQREQLQALMTTMHKRVSTALASRPGIDAEGVDAILSQVLFTGQAAVDSGLVDALVYEDELASHVTGLDARKAKLDGAGRYLSWHDWRLFRPLRRPRYIAVIPVYGAITVEPQRRPGRRAGADLKRLTSAIRAAAKDRRASAVVLHVNSPGGSALASDLIHREVEACRRHKPVVAFFGEVAASGGYYVAASADAIVAQPTSITGSIGVIMAKPMAAPLLERLGIVTETLRMSENADLFTIARPLTAAGRQILAREADRFYDTFVNVVATGRGKGVDVIEPLARGRVWSGVDALTHELVDQHGGLQAAVDEARKRVKGLAPQALDRLTAQVVAGRPGTPPPPVPPPVEAAMSLFREAMPEAGDLFALSLGNDRVLYYAAGLTTLR